MNPLEISCREAQEALRSASDAPLLLDCRERDEHALVRIDGAVLLPMSEIEARADEMAAHAGRRIVVYCHHGMRSLRVVEWLRSRGFSAAQSLAGGIDAWSTEIDPALPRY
jgi:rhodanese-related sulfurtransferase